MMCHLIDVYYSLYFENEYRIDFFCRPMTQAYFPDLSCIAFRDNFGAGMPDSCEVYTEAKMIQFALDRRASMGVEITPAVADRLELTISSPQGIMIAVYYTDIGQGTVDYEYRLEDGTIIGKGTMQDK